MEKDLNEDENARDIYFFRPDLPYFDTKAHFTIIEENGKLRIENKNVNCLFSNLTSENFDKLYNNFNQHINLEFEPVKIDNDFFELTPEEKEELLETIITSWIYYYTINNLPVVITRADFLSPQTTDKVIWILDKKFSLKNKDSRISLRFGAHILRQNIDEYTKTVRGRRLYYNR